MTSHWTHPCCDGCWTRREGDRVPSRMVEAYRDDETCCWCGSPTRSGIYVRENPVILPCNGEHTELVGG